MIETRDLTRVFSKGPVGVEALRGVSVSIPEGQFVAIVGASGSGKSTFMNVLGCLDCPTRGSYFMEGRDVSSLDPDERAEIRNRDIGFVFQAFNLIPRLSALENVEVPLFYGASSGVDQRQRAQDALEAVGLGGREEHHPTELSGGEQQRVAIARALVNRPKILLADEPTGNLDSVTSGEIMQLFGSLHRDRGLTILLVTHDSEIAASAQRILTFRDGRVVQDSDRRGWIRGVAGPGAAR